MLAGARGSRADLLGTTVLEHLEGAVDPVPVAVTCEEDVPELHFAFISFGIVLGKTKVRESLDQGVSLYPHHRRCCCRPRADLIGPTAMYDPVPGIATTPAPANSVSKPFESPLIFPCCAVILLSEGDLEARFS